MTHEERLVSMGAECVTGDLILRREVVGHYRNGQLALTPEGAALLDNVVDVEPKEPKAAALPKAPAKTKAVAKPKVAAVEVAPQAEPVTDAADDLLAGLDKALGDE